MLVVALSGCLAAPVPDDDTGVPPSPVDFVAVAFNVESGGSDVSVVASGAVAPVAGESLWGFEEVLDEDAASILVDATADAGSDQRFDYVYGTTGWEDHLVLAWDDARFELVSSEELDGINLGGTLRAPLVGHMREREHGTEFLFVINHLSRTDDARRHAQAKLLHDWGMAQTEPILMMGDYNFDWDVDDGTHDVGLDDLTADAAFVWVEPDPILPTECSSYRSVLDFAFAGGSAEGWPMTSTILDPDDSYCRYANRDTWSDHRPLAASVTIPAGD
jgi:endonuclease/exonuclease/phosphatase family metal-dependent hydrolase